MILIRDVFRLRFGKAREALAAGKETADYLKTSGHMPPAIRALTEMADPQWRILYQKFTPFAESGYREVFTIIQ